MRHGPPPARHYAGLLRACCRTADLAQGKRVHQEIAGHGDGLEALLGDRLVEMYAKCGGIQAAKQAFDSLPRKGVLAWSFLIAGYAQNGQAEAAIAAFHTMRTVLEPDGYTFVSVLGAVSSLGSRELATGLRLHALLSLGGFGKGLVVQNALVNMYAKCGSLDRAKRVFEAMNTRNVVSWTCLIAAYAQNGHAPEALELYNAMDAEPNGATFATALSACASVGAAALLQGRQIHARITASRTQQPLNVQNALVTMYAKCGCLDRAAELFAGMARKDVTSWNAMMSAYAHNGQAEKALELYKNGGPEEPNAFTFSILLGACASLKLLDEGKAVHAAFSRRLGSNTVVENGLISMYAKCGELGLARKAFDGMANSRRDAGSWNAMMAAYAQHGHPEQALRLFKDMQERPNAFTFCTALSACGALKALEDGKAVHGRLLGCADQDEVLLTTAVQNALLDMYVKCGCLGAAFRVFEGIRHKDRVSWTCIISACNQHRCHDKAFELLEDMIQHDVRPDEITYTGILAACSRLQQGQQLHLRIASQGLARAQRRRSSSYRRIAARESVRDSDAGAEQSISMMGGSGGFGSTMLREDRSRSNKLLGVVVASSSSSTSHDIELNEDEIWGEALTWGDGRSSPSRASIEAVDSSSYGYGYGSASSSPSSSSSSLGLSIPSDRRSNGGGGGGAWRRHLTRQQSAPMNVPNWSKILGNGGGVGGGSSSSAFDSGGGDGDDDDAGADARIPPHELVARGSGRSRALAFSVCEGLKGRELCRVRNAVLKQTGFL